MKYILLSFSLLFVFEVPAKETKDLAQLLKESRCVPTRSQKGVITYKCDGTLGTELRAQQKQKPVARQTKNFNRNRQPANAKPQENKIKSCLAGIYHNQINYFKNRGKFTTVTEDMGIDRNEQCNGLYIFTNVANEREFKITAQYGNAVWTVDQTRTMQKLR